MNRAFARLKWARASVVSVHIALASGSLAHGATAGSEPAGALTLAEAIETTLARNPDLAVGGYELRAADARTLQAGVRPNPELSVDVSGILGSGLAASPDERQATLTLSQVLELGGKRARRADVASSDRAALGVDQQVRELDALAEVTRRFIDVAADQEQVEFSRGAVKLAEDTERAIAARVRAARTPEAELSRARIAVIRARIESRQAQSALDGARGNLAAMWGGLARFDRVQADLYALPPISDFDALARRLERNPDFTRFASEARLRDAQVRLAQAQSRPNLTLSAGLRRFQSTGDMGFVAGFSMPLPLFDRNQGAIAEARARRDQTQASAHAERVRAQAQLFALYQQVQAGREQLAVLRREATPQAQAALEQTRYGYDRGRFSYLELASAQQELLALQITAIQVAADVHRLTAEIERLTSEAISTIP